MSICRHGYAIHKCPHPATVCNYSEEYERAKYVPPPPGAEIHPKQIEWSRKQGSPWADSQPDWSKCSCGAGPYGIHSPRCALVSQPEDPQAFGPPRSFPRSGT